MSAGKLGRWYTVTDARGTERLTHHRSVDAVPVGTMLYGRITREAGRVAECHGYTISDEQITASLKKS